MNRFGNFLGAHSVIRIAVIFVIIAIAAIAAYLGTGVYALTIGPQAIGNYMHDRGIALCLLIFATILNFVATSLCSRKHRIGIFLVRLPLSLLMTACGAALVLGLILGFMVISKGTRNI